jgi:hypothetical protein
VERNTWGRGPQTRRSDVLPTAVARALGTSRHAAEAALWGPKNLAHRCARVIAALKAAGADEALVRFIQPIDLAIRSAQPAALSGDERLSATPVPSREIAQAYLDRLYEDLALCAALRSALGASHALF